MTNYNRLINNLSILKMDKLVSYMPAFLDYLKDKDISFIDAMAELTEKEIEFRDERATRSNIQVAAFPFRKEINDYDFSFQPSVSKKQILDIASLRFLEANKNILFVGSSGVGKTHLAVSIGIEAAKKRYSTYFINCQTLIEKLNKALYENKFEQKLRHYASYRLLIIDEIGYLPVDKQGANLFFQLIARRYEKKSTIITTNQTFSKWGEVFSDNTLANAILDRLIHHSEIVKITGKSYRIQNKLIELEGKQQ
jgi:DNA replication protein DnaC